MAGATAGCRPSARPPFCGSGTALRVCRRWDEHRSSADTNPSHPEMPPMASYAGRLAARIHRLTYNELLDSSQPPQLLLRCIFHGTFVLVHERLLHRFLEHVDVGHAEFARAYALLGQHVELSEASVLRLGHSKVGVDDAKEAEPSLAPPRQQETRVAGHGGKGEVFRSSPYPKEAGVGLPVPIARIEHVGRQNTRDDADNVAAPR